MISLFNLKNSINILLEREQDFEDIAIQSWNTNDLSYHNGKFDAYNNILKEINFMIDNKKFN